MIKNQKKDILKIIFQIMNLLMKNKKKKFLMIKTNLKNIIKRQLNMNLNTFLKNL